MTQASQIPRGGWLPALGLARPVTVCMLFLAMLVLGAVAWRGIPLELLPSGFTPPYLYVQVPTLRASPRDIEQRIAAPAEELFGTVRNLRRLATRIDSNSAAFIMEFADGTDMDAAYDQVRDRLDRLLPTLDGEVGQSFIWKYNPADDPVVFMGVSTGPEVEDPGRLIEERVVPFIERIPGVSRAQLWGAPERVVAVQVAEHRAQAAGTSLFSLVQRLQRDNFALAGGTVREGDAARPVRIQARWPSLAALRELPVGNGLTLQDIAQISVQDRSERAIYRVNQRPSIFLEVFRESTANTVDVAEAVRLALERVEEDPQLSGVSFHVFFDQGDVITSALDNLRDSALWGALFAILVLLVFLRHVRMTLIITLAIPASLLATLVVMYFWGRTLNVLSLTGLMLAVGMVVDNAIVVVESIQQSLQAGRSPRQAALRGAADVALAIVVATLTTIVVFLPLILMTGSETLSFYLSQIGLPVCVALACSLVVSLLLLPLVTSVILRAGAMPRVRAVEWLEERYARVLRRVLERRLDAVVLVALAFASMAYPFKQVISTDQSQPNINDFRIRVSVPDAFTWEERQAVLLGYEQVLWDNREELGIKDLLSRMGGDFSRMQLRAFLMPPDERALDRDAIIERATALLPDQAGVRTSLSWEGGNPTNALTVSVSGPDSDRLVSISEEVARRLRVIEGVTSVRLEAGDNARPEVQVVMDRESGYRVGLTPMVVGGTLDFALRGRSLPELVTPSGALSVVIEADTTLWGDLARIGSLPLPSAVPGVTLGSTSRWATAPGVRSIDREDRRTVLSLTILTTREDVRELRTEVNAALAGYEFPRGYGMQLGGRFVALEEGQQDRIFAVTLSIVFVFLLMGILFESFVLPLSILLSIPFAFVGVWWMLFLTGTPFDTMAGVGLIILIGIVVNNGIVLVDVVGDLQRGGLRRIDALVTAGRMRLRPILMTAATTIFGLVPMAIGSATLVGIPYAPLGRAVIGGLLASTALTLFVVPLFYTFFDGAREVVQRAALQVWERIAAVRRRD